MDDRFSHLRHNDFWRNPRPPNRWSDPPGMLPGSLIAGGRYRNTGATGSDSTVVQSSKRDDGLSGHYRVIALQECRLQFLKAAARHPRIRLWQSLQNDVFNVAQGDSRKVEELLRAWSRSWNLEYDWVLSEARNRIGLPATSSGGWPVYAPSPFHPAPWYPGQDEEQYIKRAKLRLEEALRAHLRQATQARKALGLVSPTEDKLGFTWAAEYTCKGSPWSAIVNNYLGSTNYQAIQGRATPILKALGLPFHPRANSPVRRITTKSAPKKRSSSL
jgi:hypothetical protein